MTYDVVLIFMRVQLREDIMEIFTVAARGLERAEVLQNMIFTMVVYWLRLLTASYHDHYCPCHSRQLL